MSVYDNVSPLFGHIVLVGEELDIVADLVAQQKAQMELSTIEIAAANILASIYWFQHPALDVHTFAGKYEQKAALSNMVFFQERMDEEIAKETRNG